jgi:hypothetical protein
MPRRQTQSQRRWWEFQSLLLPVVAAALIAGIAWVTQAAVAAHYDSLTSADEQRIVVALQDYTDKQFQIVRADLTQIRQDLTALLLEIRQRPDAVAGPATDPPAAPSP